MIWSISTLVNRVSVRSQVSFPLKVINKSLEYINQEPQSPRTYINKTACTYACQKYHFSWKPIAEDFTDLENFLVSNITTEKKFTELNFHTDVTYDFETMGKCGIFRKTS